MSRQICVAIWPHRATICKFRCITGTILKTFYELIIQILSKYVAHSRQIITCFAHAMTAQTCGKLEPIYKVKRQIRAKCIFISSGSWAKVFVKWVSDIVSWRKESQFYCYFFVKFSLVGFKMCLKWVTDTVSWRKESQLCHFYEMEPHCRDHFMYAPTQSEGTLHCSVSHWLDGFTGWSLHWCLNWVPSSISWKKRISMLLSLLWNGPTLGFIGFDVWLTHKHPFFACLFLQSEFITLFKCWCNIYFLLETDPNTMEVKFVLWMLIYCGHETPYVDKKGSTLAQLMACYLMTSSHCLNQCWLFTRKA